MSTVNATTTPTSKAADTTATSKAAGTPHTVQAAAAVSTGFTAAATATVKKMKRKERHAIPWVSAILKKEKSRTPEKVEIHLFPEDAKLWKHFIDWTKKEVRPHDTHSEIEARAFGVFADNILRKDPEYNRHRAKERAERKKKA